VSIEGKTKGEKKLIKENKKIPRKKTDDPR